MLQKLNFTALSNEYIDNWMAKLPQSCTLVFLAISRKTIGWHKETDSISLSQIISITGLSKNSIIKAISILEESGLISVDREKTAHDRNKTNCYTINYDCLSGSSAKNELGGSNSELLGGSKTEQTKESKYTITKENIAQAQELTEATESEPIAQGDEKAIIVPEAEKIIDRVEDIVHQSDTWKPDNPPINKSESQLMKESFDSAIAARKIEFKDKEDYQFYHKILKKMIAERWVDAYPFVNRYDRIKTINYNAKKDIPLTFKFIYLNWEKINNW